MAPYLLGIDIGTTGAKSILFDAETAEVRSTATCEYPSHTPHALWSEQDPEDWWSATTQSVRSVLREIKPDQVAGIGLTGQMHGLVLLDASGRVIRPCIMWNDQRTGAQCAAITRQIGPRQLLDWIANPVLPGFTAAKIPWVRENEPQAYSRIAAILLPKDYVRYRLTGEFVTDVSDASGTALFDVRQRQWSKEMLAALEIPSQWLPRSLESTEISARVSSAAASETGLLGGTPVVAGAGDQAAQAVGAGIIQPGILSATLGTSGVVFAAADRFAAEPEGRLHTFCHAVPGQWHWMGVMLSAAGSLRWFRDNLAETEVKRAAEKGVSPYDLLTEEAAHAPAGSEGLIFLPYLSGERTPHGDPDARGVYFGLTLRHTKAHLIRALLEGVAYGLRDSLELMRGVGLDPAQVRVSGGGARSELWRQILADVFGAEIALVNVPEGAAFGAALLAGVGVGVFKDLGEACGRAVKITERARPGPESAQYAPYYPTYVALYPALERLFKQVKAAG